jgi:predicted AAA+ superfamily ATPase
MRKIYFYDTGIRNALITNFNSLQSRNDKGSLWENFMISEKLKMNQAVGIDVKSFFWRTSQQQEIDYIEDIDGNLHTYEFTFNEKKKKQISKTFLNAYKTMSDTIVNNKNYGSFLGIE